MLEVFVGGVGFVFGFIVAIALVYLDTRIKLNRWTAPRKN